MDARTDTAEPPAPRRRARWAAPAAGLGALALGAGVLIGQPWDTDSSAAVPATASPTTASPGASTPAVSSPGPDAAPRADQDVPPASAPVRLVVADAGLDVAVLPLTPTEQDVATQSLLPPETPDGYWLTSYGAPGAGSTNTTYIAGHSFEGRDAPFNGLSDPALVGSEIQVQTETGTLEYVVDSVVTHDKDTLKDSGIWTVVPDRLVLISCYTEDLWGKNVVLTAHPTGRE